MSETTMLRVPAEGPMEEIGEFRNAWGSAMRVWVSLAERYFPGQTPFAAIEGGQFWPIKDGDRLSEAEWLTFVWTFDHAICEREHAPSLAVAFRKFDAMYPTVGVSHLSAIADALEAHATDECVGFAFIQTSVNCDAWQVADKCGDLFHSSGPHDEEAWCPTCVNAEDEPSMYRRFAWDKDNDGDEHFLLFASHAKHMVEADGRRVH